MNWLKKSVLIGIFLILALSAGIVSFMYMGDLLKPHQQVEIKEEPVEVETEITAEKQASQDKEKWLAIPRKRNILVLIDNDMLARPQAGLQEADLVYELPIEGGTTRFMAVFSRFNSELIGPIRSARDYTIDLAKEHDPIFVHAGGSPLAFAKFTEIGNLNGLQGGVDRAYWRVPEREAPHNLYSDTETIRRVAIQEGFREEGKLPDFKYLETLEGFSGKESKQVSIDYGNSDFRAEYLYDEESGKYLRFTGGVKHFDSTSEQISVTNIIVQMVNTKEKDKEGRLHVELNGKNKALFFWGGKFIQGYWEKVGEDATKYYKDDGQEIELSPGRTWINIMPINAKIVY